ncbi:LacI family DNA-binding transcriptional regulator [Microbacterium paludicola]|uniref:LacI family DNA-binding transcriptional regulator n=1 Tax=Microbacterium paludicola TaxID=300019 RepID=A0A4Y9G006_9MICO|nr:LacI family DNA-binding transcriptional regulator [Microbacterium paludicola]MBF0815150.1 LacI family DNA-binding transcriptional regulator [Microbacterium paludicola]TFU34412.1 LacI family DNA-binding transcriptional regulator [Microbacterium paludicola]
MTVGDQAPHRRVTIRDVAVAAGVSVATVSKVVNGRDGIAASTSARVMGVVDELGYETSLIASSMRKSRTQVIGVFVAEFEPFAQQLLQGVSYALRDTQYDILAYAGSVSAGDHAGWERRSLSRLGGTLVDGAIIVTPTVNLDETSVPIVAIDPHTGPTGPAVIDTDNFGGARMATEHLISLGHRRVAHLRGRTDLVSAQRREDGFRAAHADAGLAVDDTLIFDGGYRASLATRAIGEMLDRDDRPTAVFAANDMTALEVIRIATERGLRVPEDLSVIGFDDLPAAAGNRPGLTTIRQPLHEMGVSAVRLLLSMLDGGATEHIRMPAELVLRDTTRAPGASA